MKGLKIDLLLTNDKVTTSIKTKGFDKNKMEDQLLLLGVLENLKVVVLERVKVLSRTER